MGFFAVRDNIAHTDDKVEPFFLLEFGDQRVEDGIVALIVAEDGEGVSKGGRS